MIDSNVLLCFGVSENLRIACFHDGVISRIYLESVRSVIFDQAPIICRCAAQTS